MPVVFRPAEDRDLAAMASIRAKEWETEAYWRMRIGGYLAGERSPQHALSARAAFVAVDNDAVVGFVAGHRTRRYGCDGELEWINVAGERRGAGIAGQLLAMIAVWFVTQGALRVCVDVEPGNTVARGFYAKFGAQRLNNHWMVWEDIRTVPRL
jgi:GNAT superfamily N-acetyltransferase